MYRALIVCNHLYEARDPKLPLLRGPEADGEMLGSALVDPSTGLFASAHVKVLFNASSLEIQEAASAFFGLAHPHLGESRCVPDVSRRDAVYRPRAH